MGDLVGSILGNETTQQTGGSWGSNAWTPGVSGAYDQAISDILSGGVPSGPGYVGPNDQQLGALAGMGSGGAAGQYYQDVLSGKGQGDRYQALLDAQQASADISNKALQGTMNNIQSAAGGVGQAGSSRQGIAQGVAASESATNLAAIQAQQNQAFLQNEQSLMTNAANAMQSIYKDQFAGGGFLQDEEKKKALEEWKKQYGQTSLGKLELILGLANNASGVAGGTQTGTSGVDNSGLFGWF